MTSARAFVVITLVNLLLTAAGYLYITHQDVVIRARQQRQGQIIERKLCTTLDRLAALQPPKGKRADLSRRYLMHQHQVLAQLGGDVGCPVR